VGINGASQFASNPQTKNGRKYYRRHCNIIGSQYTEAGIEREGGSLSKIAKILNYHWLPITYSRD
jgi:hypothetical protein